MILGQMLIRLRHHGCVLMPHQHGKTHRVHIVLQSLGRVRMANSICTQVPVSQLLLQALCVRERVRGSVCAALCVRDATAGDLALASAAVMWVAHAGWAWLVLTRLGALLDAERVLSSGSSEDEDALRRVSARHGLRWGFVSVLLMYVVGVRLQQWDLEWGLGLTLWGMVLALALATAWRARGRRGGLVEELALGPPRPRSSLTFARTASTSVRVLRMRSTAAKHGAV